VTRPRPLRTLDHAALYLSLNDRRLRIGVSWLAVCRVLGIDKDIPKNLQEGHQTRSSALLKLTDWFGITDLGPWMVVISSPKDRS
jgi:hypothetical protein